MSDQAVREAAERALEHVQELREAWRTGALSEHDGKGGTRSNRNVDVERSLLEALAAVADDSELADIEWLRSVGFEDDGTHLAFAGMQAYYTKTADAFVWRWYLFGNRIPTRKTRGDVRLLCRALGIPLKETRVSQ